MKPRSTSPCWSMDMISRVPVDQSAPGIFGVSLMVIRASDAGWSRTMPFSKRPTAPGACVRLAKAKATRGRRMPTKTRSPSWISRPAAMTISSLSVKSAMRRLVQNEGLCRGRAVGMAADGLLVDLDAQARARRHLDVAVPRLYGPGEEGGLVLSRRKLHRRASAPGRRHVKGGCESRTEIERVGGDGTIGGLGEGGDLPEFGDAADLGDAGLENVAGAALDDLAEAVKGRLVLAERDGRIRLPRHLGETDVVLGWPHGLLEPEKPVGREGPRHRERLGRRPGAVDVEHQLHRRSHRLACRAHGLDVRLVELEHGEALLDEALTGGGHGLRRVVAHEARIDGQSGTRGAPQELVDRRVPRLAEEIPERDVHTADGEHGESPAAVDHGPPMQHVHEVLDPEGVLADDERGQALLDDIANGEGRAVGEGFAHALDPGVGLDADDDLLARRPRPGRGRIERLHGNGETYRLDGGDLHGSGSIVERFGESRRGDAHRVLGVGAEPAEEPLPVGHAVHPAIEPRPRPLLGPRLLVIAVEEIMAAAVTALHG